MTSSLMAAGLVALGLAACGDNQSDGGEQADAPTTSTAATAAASGASPAPSSTSLRPPTSEIKVSRAAQAPGFIFVAPKKVFGAKPRPIAETGAEIIDPKGRVRWFRPNKGKNVAQDFRRQTYKGKPVITYWYGRLSNGTGKGKAYILDESYKRIATVEAVGKDIEADFHDFVITEDDTALLGSYRKTKAGDKPVVEGVQQELDIETNKVLTEWHSLDGVPPSDSYEPEGARSASSFDYFHINSANLDDDGNIIVSARHTWAIYKIERKTGKLLWKLGGKDSDFKMGEGTQFAWAHDAVPEGGGVYRIFDNVTGDKGAPTLGDASRVIRVKLDEKAGTVKLLSEQEHPDRIATGTQANGQRLPNGNLFVGWGTSGVFSEFTPGGRMLFDAELPSGLDTYRAYKSVWKGTPSGRPRVAAQRSGGRLRVEASWNGSTEVVRWRARTGPSAKRLKATGGKARWTNLETRFSVPAGKARFVAVEALDKRGKVLATSAAKRVSR
ncbi:MAG: aryl-sulfate sulfotransferase [Solirubrobacterales bacterium]|nr:aryl-sulfate sulfotransferase [Solirubrobacterales bacterium]